jgi:carboxymethylenebutenolidase
MVSQQVEVHTPAGTVDALLVRPDTNERLPGIIQLTDGLGFRQAHVEISQRIAERGYVVLMPNIYYRTTKPPAFDFEFDFASEKTRARFF